MVRLTTNAVFPAGPRLAWPPGLLAVLALCAAACGRSGPAAAGAMNDGPGALAVVSPELEAGARSARARPCDHTACGEDYFIDAAAGPCAAGAACSVSLTLVATGSYHINDEYPYRFKAEPVAGVEFLGSDAADKNVFSKAARNWTKSTDKTGAMSVVFRTEDRRASAAEPRPLDGSARRQSIGGVFKFSVCSVQNCRLEQEAVRATVDVF